LGECWGTGYSSQGWGKQKKGFYPAYVVDMEMYSGGPTTKNSSKKKPESPREVSFWVQIQKKTSKREKKKTVWGWERGFLGN